MWMYVRKCIYVRIIRNGSAYCIWIWWENGECTTYHSYWLQHTQSYVFSKSIRSLTSNCSATTASYCSEYSAVAVANAIQYTNASFIACWYIPFENKKSNGMHCAWITSGKASVCVCVMCSWQCNCKRVTTKYSAFPSLFVAHQLTTVQLKLHNTHTLLMMNEIN